MLERTRVQSPFYTAEHEAFRDVMRRFVSREIEPYRPRMGRSRRVSARALSEGVRDRAVGARLPGRVWRCARRPVHEDRGVAGTGARRRRRRQFEPDEPHHRLAADRACRAPRDQGQGAAAGAVGREDFRACDHRAERRFRRCQFAHQGAARRRPLCRQRREDVHHLRHAGRLSDRCGADRRRGAGRRQHAADRRRHAGPVAHQAEEDGLVGVRYRDAAFRRVPRARAKT